MTRTDDDSWDIATGVGLTAVTIAVSRAVETASERPLIVDPYAALLIDGDELRSATESFNAMRASADTGETRALIDYHVGRTRFFDDYLQAADGAGIRQHVILASGLDSRAFRLGWSTESRVFEIDQPRVLEYKEQRLRENGVESRAQWTPVGIDLRENWQRALQSAGFDSGAPTSWLAEGLLPFLRGEDQARLFRTMHSLSAPGSRLATETFNAAGGSLLETIERQTGSADGIDHALKIDDNLCYDDDGRSNPVDWWSERGWTVTATSAVDYLSRLDRPVGASGSFAALSTFVTGVKPQPTGPATG